jgi:MFS family permease
VRKLKSLIVYAVLGALVAEPSWIGYKLFSPSLYGRDPDAVDYLSMANGNFAVSAVHRYRVIIPSLVHMMPFAHHAGFFVFNVAFTALAAAFLLALLLTYVPVEYALIGLLAFVMSRDVVAAAGMPMVDSLLYAAIAAAFYGIRIKSKWIVGAVLILGPLVKENFIFLIPLMIAFGPGKKIRLLSFAALGLILAVLMRLFIDASIGASEAQAISTDFSHLGYMRGALMGLFTAHAMETLWMAFGPFWIPLIAVVVAGYLDREFVWWLPLVALQMLLSGGQYSRMAVLAFPSVAVATSLGMAMAARRWLDVRPDSVGDPETARYSLYLRAAERRRISR